MEAQPYQVLSDCANKKMLRMNYILSIRFRFNAADGSRVKKGIEFSTSIELCGESDGGVRTNIDGEWLCINELQTDYTNSLF